MHRIQQLSAQKVGLLFLFKFQLSLLHLFSYKHLGINPFLLIPFRGYQQGKLDSLAVVGNQSREAQQLVSMMEKVTLLLCLEFGVQILLFSFWKAFFTIKTVLIFISEIYLKGIKQCIKREENFIINQEKSAQLLYHIYPTIFLFNYYILSKSIKSLRCMRLPNGKEYEENKTLLRRRNNKRIEIKKREDNDGHCI